MKRRDLLQKLTGLAIAAPAAAALAEAAPPTPRLLGMGISEAAERGLLRTTTTLGSPAAMVDLSGWAQTYKIQTYALAIPIRDSEVLEEWQKLEAAARGRKQDPWDLLF